MPSRLPNMLRADFKLQWRYGLWYAAIFVTLLWIVISYLVDIQHFARLLPFIFFVDLAGFGFYLIGGMVLFERDDGVLEGLIVTPLRAVEYIASRVISMVVLSLAICVATTLGVYGLKGIWPFPQPVDPLRLIVAVVLTSILVTLIGFIAVAPYTKISHFLVPSAMIMLVLQLPIFNFFGVFASPLYYVFPTQGALWLLQSAFGPVPESQLIPGTLYLIYWIGICAMWSVQRFWRYIVGREIGGLFGGVDGAEGKTAGGKAGQP